MTALLMATALMTQRKLFSRSCAEMVFNGEGGERESEEKVEVDGGGERAREEGREREKKERKRDNKADRQKE